MEKKDLIKEISVSLQRLSLYYSEETRAFLWELSIEELELILKFTSFLVSFIERPPSNTAFLFIFPVVTQFTLGLDGGIRIV